MQQPIKEAGRVCPTFGEQPNHQIHWMQQPTQTQETIDAFRFCSGSLINKAELCISLNCIS